MASFIAQFATSESGASSDILTGLGIDWRLFVFQVIAFAILVFILSKWIFPVFFMIIDKRQEQIDASNRAAVEASKHAETAQAEIAKLLKQARVEAKDIVTTAKEEAGAMVQNAETKGKAQAEHIVAAAHEELAKEVVAAKKALHNETIELVAQATKKVVGETVDAAVDSKVIKSALASTKEEG